MSEGHATSGAVGPVEVRMLRHNRVDLALHVLQQSHDPATHPLLLLHGLGDASPGAVPPFVAAWPGTIAALDFTGHGRSTLPRGGGYSAELLLADADHALASLVGEDSGTGGRDGDGDGQRGVASPVITVLGRGLGAYIALQLAGARASQVAGAILLDGPGLAGGATGPSSNNYVTVPESTATPDQYALIELGRDLRPTDYATSFVRLAIAGSPVATPIAVCANFRPKWLQAVADAPGVADVELADALDMYAAPPQRDAR